ncbi:MAG TPA: hypothetical protein VEB66_11945 [Opitutaceae bacterium]|nr:hypothetical protein [Opitutaceae bacterium]
MHTIQITSAKASIRDLQRRRFWVRAFLFLLVLALPVALARPLLGIGLLLLASASLVPLIYYALAAPGHRRQLERLFPGESGDWLRHFLGRAHRIPWTWPATASARAGAVVCLILAVVCGALAVILFLMLALTLFLSPGIWVVFGGATTAYLYALRQFRRYGATPSRAVLDRDGRPPVVLLRSFQDDDVRLPSGLLSLHVGKPDRFEEQVAMALWREGPVIAIGKPGEKLPHFGACREYHDDSTWQARISELLPQAKCVVMIAGLTRALDWELGELRRTGALNKTVFLLPPLPPKIRAERLARLFQQLGWDPPPSSVADKSGRHLLCLGVSSRQEPIAVFSDRQFSLDYNVAVHALLSEMNAAAPSGEKQPLAEQVSLRRAGLALAALALALPAAVPLGLLMASMASTPEDVPEPPHSPSPVAEGDTWKWVPPPGWEITSYTPEVVAERSRPTPNGGITCTIEVLKDTDISAEALAIALRRAIENESTDFKPRSQSSHRIGGVEWLQFDVEATVDSIRVIYFFRIHASPEAVYTLRSICTPEDWKQRRQEIEQCLDTFSITSPSSAASPQAGL